MPICMVCSGWKLLPGVCGRCRRDAQAFAIKYESFAWQRHEQLVKSRSLKTALAIVEQLRPVYERNDAYQRVGLGFVALSDAAGLDVEIGYRVDDEIHQICRATIGKIRAAKTPRGIQSACDRARHKLEPLSGLAKPGDMTQAIAGINHERLLATAKYHGKQAVALEKSGQLKKSLREAEACIEAIEGMPAGCGRPTRLLEQQARRRSRLEAKLGAA